jgi:HEPN domain-containing protein
MQNEAKIEETRAWTEKANQDLLSAKWLLSSPDALFNAVGFHCQQSAEKTLKAFLTWHDEPFEKTHSLVALVGKCLPYDQEFQKLREAAVTLTPYAVAFRYPGDLPELSHQEAEDAFSLAQFVWDSIINKLPSDTNPQKRN